jgi:NADH-quinone oxidoreductase subunit C
MDNSKIIEDLKKTLPENLYENFLFNNDSIQIDTKTQNLLELLTFLKNHPDCQFSILTDLFGVDYLPKNPRFAVVYNLLSLTKNLRLIVTLALDIEESGISSASVFSNAVWFEREVWDMYGIDFKDSPDLRRILTDYEFEGHPLRKDFPLTGYKQVKYDEDLKKVVYEPVPDAQQYRDFDYLSPWEGPHYAMEANKK